MHAQSRESYAKYQRLGAYEEAYKLVRDGRVRHFGISFHDTAEVLDQILTEHPEVDVVLMTEPADGFDCGRVLQAIRERHPLITTIAWGGMKKDFTGPGGEGPDIHVKGTPDIRKLKEILDGLTRQRF